MLPKIFKLLLLQARRASALEDRHRIVQLLVELRRQRLQKNWAAGISRSTKAPRRRAIRAKSRKGIRVLKAKRFLSASQRKILFRKFRPSIVLDRLLPNRQGEWVQLKDRTIREPPPAIELRNFSFLDDPKSTLAGMVEIARAEAKEGAALIHFKDPYCLDVAPFILLSEFWGDVVSIFRGGDMSAPVQKVVAKVGMQAALKMGLRGVQDLDDVWAFPLSRRRPAGKTRSETPLFDVQKREIVSDQFCDALDEWLDGLDKGLGLTDEGRAWIKTIFGELLDNAERHSDGVRQDGNWSVGGFMARRASSEHPSGYEYVCRLGFINLGDSFSESLERASDDTKRRASEYVGRCRKGGCRTSDETLRTLYAIQDGVTCVERAEKEDRGGVGLQEMLELVNMLGRSTRNGLTTRVTIVSGRSCIMLRQPYIEAKRSAGDDTPRVLWCNPRNTISEPPEEEFVFDIEHHVPGTIISVGFTLDPEFLDGNNDGGNQPGGSDEEPSSEPVRS